MKKNTVFFAFALSLSTVSAFGTADPFSFPVNVAPNKIAPAGSAVFDTSKMEIMVLYQIRCHVVTQKDQGYM